MKLLELHIAVVLLVAIPSSYRAQYFTDIGSSIGIEGYGGGAEYGSGVSFFDFDNNGWDDVTIASGDDLRFFRNVAGVYSELLIPTIIINSSIKCFNWVDYDNDGDSDFFITHYQKPNILFRNDGAMTFTDVTISAGLPVDYVKHFGSSWADYDRDGFLDLYVCTYVFNTPSGQQDFDWYNHLYHNLGNGTFEDVSITSGTYDGIKLSFMGLWTDVNNDLWPDLFVINDKSNPNALYLNNGNGTFTNIAGPSGTLLQTDDPMTATGGDVNNDGMEDLCTTNTLPKPSRILLNDGDQTYTDIAGSSGFTVNAFTWGANFFDVENDRDLDVYVSEYHSGYPNGLNYFFTNIGNMTFAPSNIPGDTTNSYVNAVGDYNNDGYPDIVVLNDDNQALNFWSNNGGTNHWIKIKPIGIISNRFGVGTRIDVWDNGTHQSCYTHCGESYLAQNSGTEIFGLGTSLTTDSVILSWSSGIVDKYFNLSNDSLYTFYEGGTVQVSIEYADDEFLCYGDSIVLSTGEFSSYHWTTGDTTATITVTEPGLYSVTVTNELGTEGTSPPVEIFSVDFEHVEYSSADISCFGLQDGYVSISSQTNEIAEVIWNSDVESFTLTDLGPGDYSYEITDIYGCVLNGSISLSQPDSLYANFETTHVTCFGNNDGSIVLDYTNAVEFSITWNDDTIANDLVNIGAATYSYVLTDSAGCTIYGAYEISQPGEIVADLTTTDVSCFGESDGTIVVNASGGSGDLNIEYTGSNPDSLEAGTYTIVITDSVLCSLDTTFQIFEPEQLELSWNYIHPVYTVTISGGSAPYTISWDTGDTTLFLTETDCSVVHDVVCIDSNGCEDSITVFCVSIDEINNDGWLIKPNPSADHIEVSYPNISGIIEYKILDMTGMTVERGKFHSSNVTTFSISHLPAGTYFILFEFSSGTALKSFIRQ